MEGNNYLHNLALDDGKMSLAEFEESFWSFISENLVSNIDIDNNSEWSNMIVHDAWRMYTMSNVDHAFIFKSVENIIFAYRRYTPIFED